MITSNRYRIGYRYRSGGGSTDGTQISSTDTCTVIIGDGDSTRVVR